MSSLLIAFGLACAPLIGIVLMSYALGRADGRRAERRRRETAALGLAALKHKQGSIRL